MPELPTLPPIADAPLSVVLLLTRDEPRLDALIGHWATFLNGLDRDSELLLACTDLTSTAVAELPTRFPRVQLLTSEAPRTEGTALRTALGVARHPLIVTARCDPRYRPDDVKKLLRQIDQVHLTSGHRAGRRTPTGWRIVGELWRLFHRVVFSHSPVPVPGWLGWRRHLAAIAAGLVFGVRYHDIGSPFRLFRREILAHLPIQSESGFAHVELLAKANFLGCLLGEEVPLERTEPEELPALGPLWRDALRLVNRPDFGPPPAVEIPAAVSGDNGVSERDGAAGEPAG